MVDKCSKPSANGGEQVFVQSRAVALVLGGSSNQLPGDVITLAQERVQKRGGRGHGKFDCSWQGMREKTSPERFFSVTEVCMAACKKPPCAVPRRSLCSATHVCDGMGRLESGSGWGQFHKPGSSSLQSCSSLRYVPAARSALSEGWDPSPGAHSSCHTSCPSSASVSWGSDMAPSLGDP